MPFTGAIVGFGEVARHGHWPAYARSREVTIAAVVERTAARRALAESLIPGVATFATLEELAAALRIDFVDICTPPALHAQPILGAIERGWHVLCEKPFVLDAALLERIRGRAAAAHVAVLPVHNWKYAPIIREATRRCESGAIGELRLVDVDVSRLRAAPTADAGDSHNWRRDPALAGGGILMDHGWHAVYLALHWFRQPPLHVEAWCHYPADGAVEDEAEMMLAFPGGAASIHLTWNGEARRNRIRLVGERGGIFIDDDTLTISGAVEESLTIAPALSAGSHHDDWFSAMLPDVLETFAAPERAQAALHEAAECLAVIQQAYERDASLGTAARP